MRPDCCRCHEAPREVGSYCRPCSRERNREYHHKNREKRVRYSWERSLMREYGITPDDYNRRLEEQGGVCKICGGTGPKKLHVDHCHDTGLVRGLLCLQCNAGLGMFKDNPALVRAAVDYLEGAYAT